MTEPLASMLPPELPALTEASTTPASPANAPGKREGKVGRTVKRVWRALKRIIKRIIWGPENRDSDTFWGEKAYGIIRSFGIVGAIILFMLVVLSPLLRGILGRWGISEKEIVRNAYYLLIFIGAGIAASIATWRGRQSERQINQFEKQIKNSHLEREDSRLEREDSRSERQVARFEKAIDMATDPTSADRRGCGFLILMRMFITSGKNFDGPIKDNMAVLTFLCTNHFRMTEKRQRKAFKKLYEKSRNPSNEEQNKFRNILLEMTSETLTNNIALDLWKGIMDKKRQRFNLPPEPGIYNSQVGPRRASSFIFPGMDLRGIKFFVNLSGKIIPPTSDMRVNFRGSCFIGVDMHKTSVDHVDFSDSYLSAINYKEESKENCEMSCIGTVFDYANLINCNFGGANFKGASFIGIITLEAIFDTANLTDCKFESADLGGASFVGTNISSSDFRLAKNLTLEQFQKGAYWVRPGRPQFPNNFPHDFANKLLDKPPTADRIREWERIAKLKP